ncbi:hypothetical protein [uncultured Nostoc sp.]
MSKPKLVKTTLRLPDYYLADLVKEASELSVSVAELIRSKLLGHWDK